MAQTIEARILLQHKDKVLVMHQKGTPENEEGCDTLPGGILLANESPQDAVVRLLRQQVGIEITEANLFHAFSVNAAQDQKIILLYHVNITQESRAVVTDEFDNSYWQNIEKLQSKKLSPELQGAKNFITEKHEVQNTTENTEVKLYTDGGSRGNPGPSALGYVILDQEENVVKDGSRYLGITTNNQAEYQAVKVGLEDCLELGYSKVDVFLDSQLVANQMNGIYKIKNRDLWPIHESIKNLSTKFIGGVSFTYVPREYNKLADAMVNKELDENEKNNRIRV